MRMLEFVCFVVGVFWGKFVQAQTEDLYSAIRNNANTTKFADIIDAVKLKDTLVKASCTDGQASCLTIFVPNNAAVDRFTQMQSWGQLPEIQKQVVIMKHILSGSKRITAAEWVQQGLPLNLKDIGFGTGRNVQVALSAIRYAFQAQLGQQPAYYVDTARILQPDISASNGMIHVINEVLFFPSEGVTFIDYIAKHPSLQISASMWLKLQNIPLYAPFVSQVQGGSALYSTYFVPTDEAWRKLPADKLLMVQSNTTLLAEVFATQYLPNQIVYSQWTTDFPRINMRSGFPSNPTSPDWSQTTAAILSRERTGKVIINSGPSQSDLVEQGVKIKQAVVHTINTVLGYVYETREEVVRRLNPTLWQACQTDQKCQSMLTTEPQLTFFLPIASAMMQFNQLNSTQKALYLRYLVLLGRIDVQQLTPEFTITIDGLAKAMRFRISGASITVEGRLPQQGYVGGQLTMINQVATDGIIHVIDHIPALPFQTVQQYLSQTPDFSKYNEYRFVQTLTEGGPYIFFVPSNEALIAMENDVNLGLKLLGDLDKRQCIFQRLTFPLLQLFADLSPGSYGAPTANFAFLRERLNITIPADKSQLTVRYYQQSTVIVPADDAYQMTDGWVYKINKVFYQQADMQLPPCVKPKRA